MVKELVKEWDETDLETESLGANECWIGLSHELIEALKEVVKVRFESRKIGLIRAASVESQRLDDKLEEISEGLERGKNLLGLCRHVFDVERETFEEIGMSRLSMKVL